MLDEGLQMDNSNSSLGLKPEKGVNLDSISNLIHEPICSGFLYKYCELHYCSENIRFIIEVDKFRDFFLSETMFWHRTWREIDSELDLDSLRESRTNTKELATQMQQMIDAETLVHEHSWPSKKISRTAVESMAKYIWNTFLSDQAEFQICVPSAVLWRTMRRMRNIHLYGKEVFHEALGEPIKTIYRDIYPRFRNSEHMRVLRKRMQEVEALPPSSELHLPSLPIVVPRRYTLVELQDGVQLSLQDMLEDRICFREFFRYLQSCIVSENLRFIRALQVFKSLMGSRDRIAQQQGVEWAWRIYKFFIAPYSAYEISVSDKGRRDIMRQLADPCPDMFDTLERRTMDMLKVHFNSFRNKKEYAALNSVVLDAMEFQGDESMRAGHKSGGGGAAHTRAWGCFGIV
jgi:hypothetical protein